MTAEGGFEPPTSHQNMGLLLELLGGCGTPSPAGAISDLNAAPNQRLESELGALAAPGGFEPPKEGSKPSGFPFSLRGYEKHLREGP